MTIAKGPRQNSNNVDAGRALPGTVGVYQAVKAVVLDNQSAYPGANTNPKGPQLYRPRGRTYHQAGRAIDIGTGSGVGMPQPWSIKLFWALINMSEELGIDQVIHNGVLWNRDTGKFRPKGDHYNHIHISLRLDLANKSTEEVKALWTKGLSKPNVKAPYPDPVESGWGSKIVGPSTKLPGEFEGAPGDSAFGKSGSPMPQGGGGGIPKGGMSVPISKHMPSEENLVGLENYKLYKSIMDGTASKAAKLPESDLMALSQYQRKELASIKENMDAATVTPADYIQRGLTFAGLFGLLYSIMMIFAHVLDTTNVFFESKLLNKMTVGRVEAVEDAEDARSDGSKRYVTLGGVFKLSLIGVIVSLVIISGVVFSIATWTIGLLDM